MVLKVLISFELREDINETIEKLYMEFKKKDVFPLIERNLFLSDLEEFIDENKDFNLLILKDYMADSIDLKYNSLRRIRYKYPKVKIVLILDDKFYNSSYIKDIFDDEIYNGLFLRDASIENIVYISLNPRAKEEAESYYGLINSFKANDYSYKSKLGKPYIKSKDTILKEKIVYKAPQDYQKVIGIYSPYSLGKTVIASNLARYYSNERLDVTLIDTDFIKKDILYYFPIEDGDFLKLVQLNNDLKIGKEIMDIEKYSIEIKRNLRIFTDHRDSQYEINFKMINLMVRSSKSNIIIIDIASSLEENLINEILGLCDEKLIVADKMISTLNGLPHRLSISKYNLKNLSLVINKNIDIQGLSNRKIENYFKNIKIPDKELYNIDFTHIFFIPNKFELILKLAAQRQAAYGRDEDFDKSIKEIASSLYQIDTSPSRNGLSSIIKKLIR